MRVGTSTSLSASPSSAALSVSPSTVTGPCCCTPPPEATRSKLASWAWSKRGWVFRKLAEKHLLLPASPGKEFVTGEGFDYLGRHYRLQLTDDPPGTSVKLERGRLRLPRPAAEAGDGPDAMIRLVPPARPRLAAAPHRPVGSAHGPAPGQPGCP